MTLNETLQDIAATTFLGFVVIAVFLASAIGVVALLRAFRSVLRGWSG